MSAIMEKLEKLTSVFKYCYIIHIILASVRLLVGSHILQITSAVVLILGAIVILYRLFHIKNYIKYPFVILYIIFVVCYFVTSIINFQYGWTSNFKIMVWMVLQFGILYAFDLKKDLKVAEREMKRSLHIIVVMATMMNIISIGMLFMNYSSFYEAPNGEILLIGTAYWGRLFGIHVDPNYGSVFSVIAIMAAIYLFIRTKKKGMRIWLAITGILQMMYLSFSASRTGLVTFGVSALIFFFLAVLQRKKSIMKACIVAVLAVVCIGGINKGITAGYNGCVALVEEYSSKNHHKNPNKTEESEELIAIGRKEELSADVSNRRFDLWNNAIQLVKEKPVLGISFGNIVSYSEAEKPDSYLLTNDYAVFNAFHNMFVDLLACQGIVGAVIFLLIIVLSLRYFWVNRNKISRKDQITCDFLFSICAGITVSSLFVSEILYVHNHVTVLFWLLWGYLFCFYAKAGLEIKSDKKGNC